MDPERQRGGDELPSSRRRQLTAKYLPSGTMPPRAGPRPERSFRLIGPNGCSAVYCCRSSRFNPQRQLSHNAIGNLRSEPAASQREASSLYAGSIDLEENGPAGAVTVYRGTVTCGTSGSLCRRTWTSYASLRPAIATGNAGSRPDCVPRSVGCSPIFSIHLFAIRPPTCSQVRRTKLLRHNGDDRYPTFPRKPAKTRLAS